MLFPRELRPGQQFTATELNELARQVDQSSRATGSGEMAVNQVGKYLMYRDLTNAPLLARITGSPTSTKYPWIEVVRNADGTTTDITEFPGRFGSATSNPAVELGGRTDVPTNAIVELTLLPGDVGWGFNYTGAILTTWSATVAGILTTASQTGGGRKKSADGTDAVHPGWDVLSTTAGYSRGFSVYSFTPQIGTWAYSGGPSISPGYSLVLCRVDGSNQTGSHFVTLTDNPFSDLSNSSGLVAGVGLMRNVFDPNPGFNSAVVVACSSPLGTLRSAAVPDTFFGVQRYGNVFAGLHGVVKGIDYYYGPGQYPISMGGLNVGVTTSPPPSSPPLVVSPPSPTDNPPPAVVSPPPLPASPPPPPPWTAIDADKVGAASVVANRLVMRSPDGSSWAVTVSNGGLMSITATNDFEV